jgi:hypothetical protein
LYPSSVGNETATIGEPEMIRIIRLLSLAGENPCTLWWMTLHIDIHHCLGRKPKSLALLGFNGICGNGCVKEPGGSNEGLC